MTEFRIGVIGAGYWGKNYIRLLKDFSGVRLSFVVDSDPSTLASVAGFVPTYNDLSHALESERADAAIIVTPPSSHHRVARQCMNHGLDVLGRKTG